MSQKSIDAEDAYRAAYDIDHKYTTAEREKIEANYRDAVRQVDTAQRQEQKAREAMRQAEAEAGQAFKALTVHEWWLKRVIVNPAE